MRQILVHFIFFNVQHRVIRMFLQMAVNLIAVTGGNAVNVGSQLVEEGLARNVDGS